MKLPNYCGQSYRALDRPISQLSKQYKVGNNVVWVAFTSTSKERSVIENFSTNSSATLMLLEVTEGKDISEISLFPEAEVLLLPNAHFVVKDIISDQMKTLLNLPKSVDAIHLVQQSTPTHYLNEGTIPKHVSRTHTNATTIQGTVKLKDSIKAIRIWHDVQLTLVAKELSIYNLDHKTEKKITITSDWSISAIDLIWTLTGKGNAFELRNNSTKEEFVFCANTRDEQQKWVLRIANIIF